MSGSASLSSTSKDFDSSMLAATERRNINGTGTTAEEPGHARPDYVWGIGQRLRWKIPEKAPNPYNIDKTLSNSPYLRHALN